MKKSTLKTNTNFEGKILGLTSPESAYRLCYFINKKLSIDFQKQQTSSQEESAEKQPNITIYKAKTSDEKNKLFLVPNKNKAEGTYQMPDFKKIDFLFIIEGESAEELLSTYKNQLKSINVIQAIFELPKKNFKPEKILNLD